MLLLWVKGNKRVVLDAQLYQPESGKSKIDIALAMLSYARNTLKIKPEFVLFDSWYAAKAIMKRLTDYGWGFVSRIKKNRLFNGKKLSLYRLNPYWNETGLLAGGLKVRIVKNGKKFFVTNRLSLSRIQILEIYKSRQSIEEVNKQLKYIGLNDCQCLSLKAQSQYVWICVLAFSLLERESRKREISLYHLKKINIYSNERSLIDWGAEILKVA